MSLWPPLKSFVLDLSLSILLNPFPACDFPPDVNLPPGFLVPPSLFFAHSPFPWWFPSPLPALAFDLICLLDRSQFFGLFTTFLRFFLLVLDPCFWLSGHAWLKLLPFISSRGPAVPPAFPTFLILSWLDILYSSREGRFLFVLQECPPLPELLFCILSLSVLLFFYGFFSAPS